LQEEKNDAYILWYNYFNKGEQKMNYCKSGCDFELEFFENGDVLHKCKNCKRNVIILSKDIKNNHLNPYIKK
jgi:hypothetical protein